MANIDEKTILNELKVKYNDYKNHVNKRIEDLRNLKETLTKSYDGLKEEIDTHFKELIEKEIHLKRNELEQQLRLDYDMAESEATSCIDEAMQVKRNIETTFQTIESTQNTTQTTNRQFYNDFDNNDDALMISEANEEIDQFSQTVDLNNNATINSNAELAKINELMSKELSFDRVDNELSQFIKQKFSRCKPELKEFCFGHFKVQQVLAHSDFLIENNSSENIFVKSQPCSLKISSPATYSRDINIHEFLKFELYDPKKNQILYELKERCSNSRRYIKLTFTPELHGIHKLSIKYKNGYIPSCPFYFNVLKEANTKLSQSSTLNSIASYGEMDSSVKLEPGEIVEQCTTGTVQQQLNSSGDHDYRKSMEKLNGGSNNHVNGSTMSLNGSTRPAISAGRGRLFKKIINEQANKARAVAAGDFTLTSNSSISFTTTNDAASKQLQSQKRKSPLINYFDENDVSETDVEMRELQTKLKRVVVDETNNQYYQYPQKASNFDYSRLGPITASSLSSSTQPIAHLDNHLRKYASQRFGDTPGLKAIFQRKFTANMSYPIGVTSSKLHNWVLVADSGNNAVKVFERTSAEPIFVLKGDPTEGATLFRRPSALLLSSNDGELYVKDDVQIQVFDIENNFKFKRRFGEKVLKRPYGLAFDENENIVCVDADLRQPLIYTFNKGGKVLNAKTYQPVVKDLTMSLNYPNISKNILPFEQSKIRFIASSKNCLYSSDLGRSIVYKTTLDGEILFAFGHFGKLKGELNEPSGLYVDPNGTILVGDSKNSRLQIYDNQGKYRCDIEFANEKIRRPSDIYIDEDGYLYITCFLDHCVKKFKLES